MTSETARGFVSRTRIHVIGIEHGTPLKKIAEELTKLRKVATHLVIYNPRDAFRMHFINRFKLGPSREKYSRIKKAATQAGLTVMEHRSQVRNRHQILELARKAGESKTRKYIESIVKKPVDELLALEGLPADEESEHLSHVLELAQKSNMGHVYNRAQNVGAKHMLDLIAIAIDDLKAPKAIAVIMPVQQALHMQQLFQGNVSVHHLGRH